MQEFPQVLTRTLIHSVLAVWSTRKIGYLGINVSSKKNKFDFQTILNEHVTSPVEGDPEQE